MNKIFTLFLLGAFALCANAQTQPLVPSEQPYGKITNEDLTMKACDFEKDANAMVLFSKCDQYFDQSFFVIREIHKRVKIFNDNGKDAANIHIPFFAGNHLESVGSIDAETINLVDGKPVITKLDKKLIYIKHVNKFRDELVFTMPNITAGSVFEYKYKWQAQAFYDFPDWYFQEKIPVRYSELDTEIPEFFYFKTQTRTRVPYYKHSNSSNSRTQGDGADTYTYNNETEVRAMANVPSLPDEPYMTSDADNLECVIFQLTQIRPTVGFRRSFSDTWAKIGGELAEDEDFGGQLKRKLANEDEIINKAAALKTNGEKIAYIFDAVKTTMKWNNDDDYETSDGTSKAWDNKSGNSAEINLILYHLLKKSGLDAYPMVVSTRAHGKVNKFYPSLYQFNRAVVYIPIDSTREYILDATGKYNTYNEIPDNLLNSSGLYIDKEKKTYDIIFLEKADPVRQVTLINAEIKPGGKMSGTAQMNSFSYNRISAVKRYKTDGEKKYIDYLTDGDNNLKISAIRFDNMEVDTLPLTQNIDFNLDLTGSDDSYIYFTPNVFTSVRNNPFLSENRNTDIDFGYRNNYTINGMYKEPAGYKVDALPKSVSMTLPDKSITFRRIVAEQDGSIVVRYTIDFKKSIYFKEGYPDLHDFYKKLHELMSEQIVLKKT